MLQQVSIVYLDISTGMETDWSGQVENAEVRKPKYGNGSTETEVRKWEEKPPLDV